MTKRICSVAGCPNPHGSKGYCPKHYQRWKTTGDPLTPSTRHANDGPCLVDGCEAQATVKSMCRPCYQRDYDRRNAEKKRAVSAAWRAANPEKVKALNLAWRRANPDLEREMKRAYAAANRERIRILSREIAARRKARKGGNVVTKADYAEILTEFGMVCHICTLEIPEGDLHFDHVIPLAAGGPHSKANIRPSHRLCNQRKGARIA